MKQKIFIFLIIFFILHLGFRIYGYKDNYISRFDPEYWKDRFEHSQWHSQADCMRTDPHINPHTCEWDDAWYAEHKHEKFVPHKVVPIGDDGLYTYVAWEMIHGADPTSVNAEIPPFGKYVLGITEILFKNQNIFALLSGLLVLISFFILNKIIFKDNFFAFLPVFVFSLDPLFYTQLRAPFLDLLYLGLLLLTFIFVLKKKFLFAAIFLGLVTATKASSTTFILIVAAVFIYLFMTKDYKAMKRFVLTLPIALTVFGLTYIQFFLHGNSIKEFLGVQKYILNFYATGVKGDPTSALQILVSGYWPNWFGQNTQVPEWTPIWALSLGGTIYYMYTSIIKRNFSQSFLLAVWVATYLIFLLFVPVWPRYLLVVLPFMYILLLAVSLKGSVKN